MLKIKFALITWLLLSLCVGALGLDNPNAKISPPKPKNLKGVGRIVLPWHLISKEQVKQGISSYKLVSLFDKNGNHYDTQLYVTLSFADWNYIHKGTSYGKHIVVTPIKKKLNCKTNPCSYLETVAIHFKNPSDLSNEANKDGMYSFKLIGKFFEKEYAIPRNYIKEFALYLDMEQTKDTVKQMALKNQDDLIRLKASLD